MTTFLAIDGSAVLAYERSLRIVTCGESVPRLVFRPLGCDGSQGCPVAAECARIDDPRKFFVHAEPGAMPCDGLCALSDFWVVEPRDIGRALLRESER